MLSLNTYLIYAKPAFFSSVNLATLALGYVSSSVLVCFTVSRILLMCLCKVNQNT